MKYNIKQPLIITLAGNIPRWPDVTELVPQQVHNTLYHTTPKLVTVNPAE